MYVWLNRLRRVDAESSLREHSPRVVGVANSGWIRPTHARMPIQTSEPNAAAHLPIVVLLRETMLDTGEQAFGARAIAIDPIRHAVDDDDRLPELPRQRGQRPGG